MSGLLDSMSTWAGVFGFIVTLFTLTYAAVRTLRPSIRIQQLRVLSDYIQLDLNDILRHRPELYLDMRNRHHRLYDRIHRVQTEINRPRRTWLDKIVAFGSHTKTLNELKTTSIQLADDIQRELARA